PRDCVRAFCRPPAAPVLHTLPLHDALPIYVRPGRDGLQVRRIAAAAMLAGLAACTPQVVVVARVVDLVALGRVTVAEPVGDPVGDRKSTRLNSSHVKISYAVFCLKQKTAYP